MGRGTILVPYAIVAEMLRLPVNYKIVQSSDAQGVQGGAISLLVESPDIPGDGVPLVTVTPRYRSVSGYELADIDFR